MTTVLAQMTAGRLLSSAAARFPDSLAFYCAATGRSATFREIDRRVTRLAHALLGLGLAKGDVVAFLGTNRLEVVEIYFAVGRAGLVGLPLSYRSMASDMASALRSGDTKALFYEAQFAERAEAIRDHLPAIGFGETDGTSGYEALISDAPSDPVAVSVDEHDPFYFNMTSGTTGHPKSYVLSHYNNTTVGAFIQAMDLSRDDVILTVFPLFGRVGFGWVSVSVMLGIPNVLADFEPARVLSLIASHRVTTVNLVPTMGSMLLPAQQREPRDLGSLRAVIFAGSALPSALRSEVSVKICNSVYEFYGMNEMGPLCVSAPQDRKKRPNSVGRPLVFSELLVVGPDDHPLPADQVGELLGRSPMSAVAYHGDPAGTSETFRDGWVHTGDLGSLDEGGYLTLRGRKKDMIVTGGQNVYAAEVENVLADVPGLSEYAVIGLPDDFWGERVVAVMVASGTPPTIEFVERHCRANLPSYKVPKAFFFENEPLPRTSTAKVQKFKLIERLSRSSAAG